MTSIHNDQSDSLGRVRVECREEAYLHINHLYCDLFDENLHGHKQGVKCTLAADSEMLMQKKEKPLAFSSSVSNQTQNTLKPKRIQSLTLFLL